MSDSRTVSAVAFAAKLTVAWLSNSGTRADADDASAFLDHMFHAVGTIQPGSAAPNEVGDPYQAAVSVRKSLASKDHIVSMIDGKPYRTLRRHLRSHGLSPETYRERYGLRADYPMVAETYSQRRSDMAKKSGLGRTSGRGRNTTN